MIYLIDPRSITLDARCPGRCKLYVAPCQTKCPIDVVVPLYGVPY